MAKQSKIVILFLSLFVFYKCAHEVYPPGGPIDKTPPKIVEVDPPNNNTNFTSDKIIFTFDEYLDERNSLSFIYFSPDISKFVDKFFSGKDLVLEIPDSVLIKNTTYVITLGTDISDFNRGNKLAEPFVYTFSTGEKISKAVIKGTVYDKNPQGTLIGAYEIDSLDFNPEKIKPKYVSQAGENGNYILRGLSEGTYRLFAIKDDYRDLIYNPNDDWYGITSNDIRITNTDTIITGLNFILSLEDTLPPGISNVTMTDKNHLLVEFTEEIDSSSLHATNFSIVDTVSNNICNEIGLFKGRAKENSIFLAFNCNLNDSVQFILKVDSLIDVSGNKVLDEKIEFAFNDKPDSNKLMFNVLFGNKENKIDINNPEIILNFNDAINNSIEEIESAISFYDIEKKLNYNLKFIDNAKFKISFLSKLKSEHKYNLKIDLSKLEDFAGNVSDTLITKEIETYIDYTSTGLYGYVEGLSFDKPVVRLVNIESEIKYQQKINDDKKFSFEKVIPGKYRIMVFDDKDNDGKLYKGYLNPFKFAEKFLYSTDTLNLRPRWPVANYKLKFNNEQL